MWSAQAVHELKIDHTQCLAWNPKHPAHSATWVIAQDTSKLTENRRNTSRCTTQSSGKGMNVLYNEKNLERYLIKTNDRGERAALTSSVAWYIVMKRKKYGAFRHIEPFVSRWSDKGFMCYTAHEGHSVPETFIFLPSSDAHLRALRRKPAVRGICSSVPSTIFKNNFIL